MKFPHRGVRAYVSGLLVPAMLSAALAAPIRILPLGDSITVGQVQNAAPTGYRGELYRDLTFAGYEVDLLGTLTDASGGDCPDPDHQGVNSARIDQLQAGLNGWLDALPDPDVILLLVGTNDFWQNRELTSVSQRYENLLLDAARRCPFTKIIAASLPLRSDDPRIEALQVEFNAKLLESVNRLRATGHQIYFVDQHATLTPTLLVADGVHPSKDGYQAMAHVWSAAVRNVISPYGTDDAPAVLRSEPDETLTRISLQFSKPLADDAADPAHFRLPEGTSVISASLIPDQRTVLLETSPLSPGKCYPLSLTGIRDRAPQAHSIAPGTVTSITTPTLKNGGFETNDSAWSFTGNTEIVSWLPYQTSHGSRMLALNSNQSTPNGNVSQTFATVPGQNYQLTFDFGILAYTQDSQSLRTRVLGTIPLLDETVTLQSSGEGNCAWNHLSYSFTADSAATTLIFDDISTASANLDGLLDEVNVQALPVPELVNGGFEANSFPWESAGNQKIMQQSPTLATEGSSFMVFNAEQTPPDGFVTQSVRTDPGKAYVLEYHIGAMGDPMAAPAGVKITVDGEKNLLTTTNSLPAKSATSPVWKRCIKVFVADSQITTLRFQDVSTICHNIDLLLDGVSLHPASPQTLTLDATGASPIELKVCPSIADGSSGGAAPVAFQYQQGSSVTFSAPAHAAESGFSHWLRKGQVFSAQPEISLELMESVNFTAVYSPDAAPSVLTNGSFETGLSDWNLQGNAVVIDYYAPYETTDGNRLMVFNGGQTAPNAQVTQAFPTTTGGYYEVRLSAGVLSYHSGVQSLRVRFLTEGPSPVEKVFSWQGSADGSVRWFPLVVPFQAFGNTTTLVLEDASTDGNATDLLLDGIQVLATAAPPETPPGNGEPTAIAISGTPGAIMINFQAPSAANYRLEKSTNLTSWREIGNLDVITAGPAAFQDTEPAEFRAFYRIKWDRPAPITSP